MPSDPKTDVLRLLVDRIPNYVNEVTIQQRLKQHQTGALTTALQDLVAAGTVEVKVDPQPSVGKPANYYRLKNFLGLPVRQSIRVGDVEIPRLLADSQTSVFPETFNEGNELLADYINDLERRFVQLVEDERRRYWADVVGVFGILVSVLALILTGLPKIATDPSWSMWRIVAFNTAQLLPLAVILAVFVLALRWLIRGRTAKRQ